MQQKIRNKLTFCCLLMVLSKGVLSQNNPPVGEEQLENIVAKNADKEIDDDSYLQEMQQFIANPININKADRSELKQLKIITDLQIDNLIRYLKVAGTLVSIYELQAIPGWSLDLIHKVLQFITIQGGDKPIKNLLGRFKHGKYTLLVRESQLLQQAKGYNSNLKTHYLGSPIKLFCRIKYSYKNTLQYGITADKDAGEQLFRGSQKNGFDFYSAHLFARNVGMIKNLAIGDYTVNMGQGLIQWQSLAFDKGSEVINIKRQSDILRPYNSSGEINFHRGLGITLKKKRVEVTAFASYRKIDGNLKLDTLTKEEYLSSLQTSGYHRTLSEIADKNVQEQFVTGGNVQYRRGDFNIGFNTINYHFSTPIRKAPELYNKFTFSGTRLSNYSVDYGYTFRNVHFFGELASDDQDNKAFVGGLLISADSKADVSLLYRNIPAKYRSLYASAFTESATPANEKGLYAGVSIYPSGKLKLDAYADLYSFPWLKYRVDASSKGSDYLLQLSYKPNKQLELIARYRSEKKAINLNTDSQPTNPVVNIPREDFRGEIQYRITPTVAVRTRAELVWYNKYSPSPEQGFLIFSDVTCKVRTRLSAGLRLQYFQTDSYNSRIYAYENDVLYSFSIPVFYDKGYRYYVNINYKLNRFLSLWARVAETLNPEKTSVGSGLDEIQGDRRTEIKVQAIMSF